MDHPAMLEPPQADPKIIFVLGMHRSGTSVLAHTINLMGAFVGDDSELVPAHPDINPTGYWERADIVAEHDRFLQANGFAWATVANFAIERIEENWRHNLAAELQSIVRRVAPRDSALVIKDPRLCLMLPVWQEFVTAPAHVVVVRDPRKIAASLMAAFLRDPRKIAASLMAAFPIRSLRIFCWRCGRNTCRARCPHWPASVSCSSRMRACSKAGERNIAASGAA